MRTLVLSDLHLGSVANSDLLRRADVRSALLAAVSAVDRVVLLGDSLELRQGPPREALAAARPFFEDLGRALAGRELIVTAGNHDHALVESWLARRAETDGSQELGLEQLLTPAEASPMLERIAAWVSPARVSGAYPGLWLRSDVYATHGHYLDCHMTMPTLERLGVGVMGRLLGRPQGAVGSVEDYEAVTGPVYAWRDAVARHARTSDALNGMATVRAWGALRGGGDRNRARRDRAPGRSGGALTKAVRKRALVAAFAIAVGALNRAGLGPLKAEISMGELRRAGLAAMGQVATHLGLGDAYVVFGHTHRAGPLAGDDEREWRSQPLAGDRASGARLVNTGCWTYDSIFLTSIPGESPYWPGTCVLVEDSGAPVLQRLLLDRQRAELRPPRRA